MFDDEEEFLHVVDDDFSSEYVSGFKAAMDQVMSTLQNIARNYERKSEDEQLGLIPHVLEAAWYATGKRCYPGSNIIEANKAQEAKLGVEQ